jgi:hypothetical protein
MPYVSRKRILVCYIFVSVKFNWVFSLLGHLKFKGLKLFQDINQDGMDTMLFKVKVPCNRPKGPERGESENSTLS